MLQVERQNEILQLLNCNRAMRVGQLAKALYTSEATVRRDLSALEKRGAVRRVFGGVVLERDDLPLDLRSRERAALKEEIAERAAELVSDGDTVFLDASSTALHLVSRLVRKNDLTLITNSYRVVELTKESKLRIFCTGGELVTRNLAFVGRTARETLGKFCPDIAFFSCQGVSENGEMTDDSEEETALRQQAIAMSRRPIFLCDSGKVGKTYLFRLGNTKEMNTVVTDGAFPPHLLPKKE